MKIKKLSTKKLLSWLDKNILIVLAGFLLAFIPLNPKIPLFDALPGYIVRIRLEDFAILSTAIVWLIQIKRGKAKWKHPLLYLVIAYLTVGLLSTLSALFITKTVPLDPLHIGKMYFHYIRHIQYLSLLFIFFSAVRTKKQAINLIFILAITMIGVALYGYGQKYFYWPVYSTMNREFAKGWRLYLTEHARVPSTFGGHYDLAAFTMIVLTILLSLFFLAKKRLHKALFGVAFLLSFWLLILTASRTSFIAYLLSITVLMGIFFFIKSWKWAIPRWFLVMFFSIFVMLSFGDLSERFTQVLGLDKIREKYSNLAFLPKIKQPDEGIPVKEISLVTTSSDTPPTPKKPGASELPPDVYEDIPLKIKTEGGGTEVVSRTYSENAYKYGLSAAIRFDALWPRAWAGFEKNPLLGSGYSTLTKEAVEVFTEAESTDNNFLRTLGETGLLGFITFYGIILYVIFLTLRNLKKLSEEPLLMAFAVGMVAAIIGLLLNASYIDVFVASKVAEPFWALIGLLLAILYGISLKKAKTTKK